MNRILLFIGLTLLPTSWIWGQQPTFVSHEMEAGVRLHLGIDDTAPLTAEQLASITSIDLSSMGITDISDIAYMPNLESLNLRDNGIRDITPLLVLESLRDVDLSYNDLSSIFALSFSRSEEMKVDVAFNHIGSFSCFSTFTPCRFTIKGAGLQQQPNTPYFLVRYLYSDGTEEEPKLLYRVDATTTDQVLLQIDGGGDVVVTDNELHTLPLPEATGGARCATITDGIHVDSTYVVPRRSVHVDPNGQVSVATGLPECYEINYSTETMGTATIDGTTLSYTAPEDFDFEEVIYSFYWGGKFKGISKVIFTSEEVSDGISTAQMRQPRMELRLEGDMLFVRLDSEGLADASTIEVCDIAGRVIVSKQVDSHLGINEQIRLSRIPKDILIVKVTSGRKRYVDKLAKR